ncbi:MAG: ATP-binding domain-containing protein, partial [Spirochaetales bacterium]|nr:ATP-binding domain-containing protein [Spirochaetales bacterium]
YLKDAIEDVKSSELYVGTIHSVKGLEYDNVFVMNVGSYNFQLKNEDMKNLFYVAITRAKNRLLVYKLFDS